MEIRQEGEVILEAEKRSEEDNEEEGDDDLK
jgi:hypothetical protein